MRPSARECGALGAHILFGRRRRRERSGVAALERDAGPKNSQRNSCATSLPRRPRGRGKRAFGTRHRIDVDADMDHRPLLRLNLATFAALPAMALAHHEVDASGSSFESWLIVLLAASAIGYGWGVADEGSFAFRGRMDSARGGVAVADRRTRRAIVRGPHDPARNADDRRGTIARALAAARSVGLGAVDRSAEHVDDGVLRFLRSLRVASIDGACERVVLSRARAVDLACAGALPGGTRERRAARSPTHVLLRVCARVLVGCVRTRNSRARDNVDRVAVHDDAAHKRAWLAAHLRADAVVCATRARALRTDGA